jgi:hypothetical protein
MMVMADDAYLNLYSQGWELTLKQYNEIWEKSLLLRANLFNKPDTLVQYKNIYTIEKKLKGWLQQYADTVQKILFLTSYYALRLTTVTKKPYTEHQVNWSIFEDFYLSNIKQYFKKIEEDVKSYVESNISKPGRIETVVNALTANTGLTRNYDILYSIILKTLLGDEDPGWTKTNSPIDLTIPENLTVNNEHEIYRFWSSYLRTREMSDLPGHNNETQDFINFIFSPAAEKYRSISFTSFDKSIINDVYYKSVDAGSGSGQVEDSEEEVEEEEVEESGSESESDSESDSGSESESGQVEVEEEEVEESGSESESDNDPESASDNNAGGGAPTNIYQHTETYNSFNDARDALITAKGIEEGYINTENMTIDEFDKNKNQIYMILSGSYAGDFMKITSMTGKKLNLQLTTRDGNEITDSNKDKVKYTGTANLKLTPQINKKAIFKIVT